MWCWRAGETVRDHVCARARPYHGVLKSTERAISSGLSRNRLLDVKPQAGGIPNLLLRSRARIYARTRPRASWTYGAALRGIGSGGHSGRAWVARRSSMAGCTRGRTRARHGVLGAVKTRNPPGSIEGPSARSRTGRRTGAHPSASLSYADLHVWAGARIKGF
jgi:hypothetical protein